MNRLAILSGHGALPLILAKAYPDAVFVQFDGLVSKAPGQIAVMPASFERFGALFDGLSARGVSDVVFAGGLSRPALDPAKFDAKMIDLAPKFLAAMQGGDDGLLRAVIAAFEGHGFTVRGAHELCPDLVAAPGLLAGPAPSEADHTDVARARAILYALGPLDVGQGAVVAAGQVLGIETAQGTDAMLQFVANASPRQRPQGGVLVKAPKPGQDLRIDMPAIGVATVAAVAKAGLAGIVIDARQVLLIERAALLDAAQDAGVFVLADTAQ